MKHEWAVWEVYSTYDLQVLLNRIEREGYEVYRIDYTPTGEHHVSNDKLHPSAGVSYPGQKTYTETRTSSFHRAWVVIGVRVIEDIDDIPF